MTARSLGARVAAALAVGALVATLAVLRLSGPAPVAAESSCFTALRLVRHAIAAFERQHGRLPGSGESGALSPAAEGDADPDLVVAQLTQPRDAHGMPDPRGPYPGLIDALPVNPYTGARTLVVIPDGADAVAFAAASPAGWAYLPRAGHDGLGTLPAGLVLPCGRDRSPAPPGRTPKVQDLAFEIEDFQRWR